jgi:hypothetical protein
MGAATYPDGLVPNLIMPAWTNMTTDCRRYRPDKSCASRLTITAAVTMNRRCLPTRSAPSVSVCCLLETHV